MLCLAVGWFKSSETQDVLLDLKTRRSILPQTKHFDVACISASATFQSCFLCCKAKPRPESQRSPNGGAESQINYFLQINQANRYRIQHQLYRFLNAAFIIEVTFIS
ncbi:hypothetical protein AV530_004118 [Patagioenas fasciata monilis]|uniref:Uncharacterized protein n=1 Tax=Patagioenas fasciata monilis TaxID=372326 RepID=A0A1V4JRI8_PATFA|nr:hypothetical protein AV530_004118 [Patagioenas fasciata monilis]